MTESKLRCVVVGDGTVGKTCLLIRYIKNDYPTDYVPTIFDSFAVTIPVNTEDYELHLIDTAGQEEYDEVRKLAFTDVDVFLVCFSVDLWSSFQNVREKWLPELQRLCPDVPFLLIGTKIDLRYNQDAIQNLATIRKSPISKTDGEKLATELNAAKYLECSALTKENVAEIFQEAVEIAIQSRNPTDQHSKKTCSHCTRCIIL